MYVLIMARDKPFREFITSNEASRHESKTQAFIPDFRHVGTPRPDSSITHVSFLFRLRYLVKSEYDL